MGQRLTQLICSGSGIAENDEVVAVEDFIYVGNILGKIWVSLSLSRSDYHNIASY